MLRAIKIRLYPNKTQEQAAFWRSIDKKWLNYSPKVLNMKDAYLS